MPPLEIPMLATKKNLDQPIIGFNVIEEVIKYCDLLQPEALVEKEALSEFSCQFSECEGQQN